MTAHHEIKVGGTAPFDDPKDPENNRPAVPLQETVVPEQQADPAPPPPPLDRAAFVTAGYPDDDAVYAEYLTTGSVPPKPDVAPEAPPTRNEPPALSVPPTDAEIDVNIAEYTSAYLAGAKEHVDYLAERLMNAGVNITTDATGGQLSVTWSRVPVEAQDVSGTGSIPAPTAPVADDPAAEHPFQAQYDAEGRLI